MRFYVSHSIRGSAGKNATPTQMQANCDTIIAIVKQLRGAIPVADFYVPAESEPFVIRAYREKYITEVQILDIDCKIIKEICDAVIVYVPKEDYLQGGRLVEFNFAEDNNIPVFLFQNIHEAISWIAHLILRA